MLYKHSMTEEQCIDAIQSGDSEAVRRLVRSGVGINTRFYNGYTLLHLAVLYGNDSIAEDVLEYWTEACGDVNVKTSNGNTPLHLAVAASFNISTGVVAAVCRAGADLHAPDSCGKTPLELAISRGHNDVADYLRQRDSGAHAHEDAPALAADTDAESVGLCYTRIQGSTDQSGSSSASVRLSFNEQTNSVSGDWLSDYIQELLKTYDRPRHEEMRKWIIDEIPCLYGIGPQTEVDVNGDSSWQMLDTITRARLSKIKKLLSDMSRYPQICELLRQIQERLLSAANVVIPQDHLLDYGATLGQDMEPADRPTDTSGRVNESCAETSASTPGILNKAGSSSTSGAVHSSYSCTLEDDIQWLVSLFDRHEHEEIRNGVINEIPRLVGMDPSPHAGDDALWSARSLKIRDRLIQMSMTDDQSRRLMFLFLHQLLMLREKQEDDEPEYVVYPSDDDEENDTDDEMDGQHLERTEPSLQEPVTELEALENRSSLHINHD